jgi:hypothetical protein
MSGVTDRICNLHIVEDERSYQSNRSLERDRTTPLATDRRMYREQLMQVEQRLQSTPFSEADLRKSLEDDRERLSSMLDKITRRTGRGKLTTGEVLRTTAIGRSIRVALHASNNDVPTHLSLPKECAECQWIEELAVCINCSASVFAFHRDVVQRTRKRHRKNMGSSTCVCSNARACKARTQAMQNALTDFRGAD